MTASAQLEHRLFNPHELSAECAVNLPLVAKWKETVANAALLDYCQSHRGRVLQSIDTVGGVLFRATGVCNAEDYGQVLAALHLNLDQEYLGGLSPRKLLYKGVWTSTEAPSPIVIGYHTEMAYTAVRPRWISFFCQTPALAHGETPVFDTSIAYCELTPGLREKLARGLVYRRHFVDGERAAKRSNYHKSWQEAFKTSTRGQLQAQLQQRGVEFEWGARGDLYTLNRLPAVLQDRSGTSRLNIILFDRHSWSLLLKRFSHRFSLKDKLLYLYLIYRQAFTKDIFIETLHADGSPFSLDESVALQEAFWKSCLLFAWQAGDVLFLDNIKLAHGRMNFRGNRSVLAALAGQFDVGLTT